MFFLHYSIEVGKFLRSVKCYRQVVVFDLTYISLIGSKYIMSKYFRSSTVLYCEYILLYICFRWINKLIPLLLNPLFSASALQYKCLYYNFLFRQKFEKALRIMDLQAADLWNLVVVSDWKLCRGRFSINLEKLLLWFLVMEISKILILIWTLFLKYILFLDVCY